MLNKRIAISIALSSLALPLTLVSSLLVALVYKSNNSANIDITAGLAYLRPVVITAFTVFTLCIVSAVLLAIFEYRSNRVNSKSARFAILLALLVVMLTGGAAIAQNRVERVEEAYSQKKLQNFFKDLSN